MNKNTLILVVEDEDEIADILMSYLERSGMKTLRARQGEQAITLNRLHKPDLILLDIHLPVCDGWSVLTTLRHESAVPVIMVSALDQDVDKLMGLRLGADDYVIKPFNPSEVVARVEAVLRRTKPALQQAGEEFFLHPAADDPADEQQGQRTDAPGCKGQPAFQQQPGDGKAEIVDSEEHRNKYLPDE